MSGGDFLAGLAVIIAALSLAATIATAARNRGQQHKRTGDATATDGGYANTGVTHRPAPARPNYDRSPAFRDARARVAAELAQGGRTVLLPREVANYAENILIKLGTCDAGMNALTAMGWDVDALRIAGCRQAISDAIEAADQGDLR